MEQSWGKHEQPSPDAQHEDAARHTGQTRIAIYPAAYSATARWVCRLRLRK